MREIRPYKTVQGARRALDNGGRFYNLFTQAGDDLVTAPELARAAGVHSAGADAIIFFEMALMELSTEEREVVLDQLSPELRAQYDARRPMPLAPSVVESQGKIGLSAVVSGYPVFVEDKSEFKGYIVMVVPMIMLIPIMDQFDVYEVFDDLEMRERRTVIATTRGSKRLDGIYTRFGGVLKELQFDDKTGKEHGFYLEASYYTPLGSATAG